MTQFLSYAAFIGFGCVHGRQVIQFLSYAAFIGFDCVHGRQVTQFLSYAAFIGFDCVHGRQVTQFLSYAAFIGFDCVHGRQLSDTVSVSTRTVNSSVLTVCTVEWTSALLAFCFKLYSSTFHGSVSLIHLMDLF